MVYKRTPEQDFLEDFDLHSHFQIKRTLKKNPAAYGWRLDSGEGAEHITAKSFVYNYLLGFYGDLDKMFITTELKQQYSPFVIKLDDEKIHYKFYTLDVCAIYFDNKKRPMILDVEIDGQNHYKKNQMKKDKLRDRFLSERYNVHVERIDAYDPNYSFLIAYLRNRIG